MRTGLVVLGIGLGLLILGLVKRDSFSDDAGSQFVKELPVPKRVTVPRLLSGNIKIDGDLNEPAWTNAALIQSLYDNSDSRPEREHTEIRLWYDKSALYLGWTCQDSDLQATLAERDSPLWKGDVVEFFVTREDLSRYFEFEWNPLNAVFDGIVTNDLDERGVSIEFHADTSYTAKTMESAVKKTKRPENPGAATGWLWQVEVRIPFVEFGWPPPKPGDVWRANFYRYNYGPGSFVQQVSWSPTLLPGFHQPSRFGFLEFGREK